MKIIWGCLLFVWLTLVSPLSHNDHADEGNDAGAIEKRLLRRKRKPQPALAQKVFPMNHMTPMQQHTQKKKIIKAIMNEEKVPHSHLLSEQDILHIRERMKRREEEKQEREYMQQLMKKRIEQRDIHRGSDASKSAAAHVFGQQIMESTSVKQTLKMRMQLLHHLAFSGPKVQCNSRKHTITLHGHKFGRSSNTLIEFTHALWLAEKLNAVVIIPHWMYNILERFRISSFKSHYCFSEEKRKSPRRLLEKSISSAMNNMNESSSSDVSVSSIPTDDEILDFYAMNTTDREVNDDDTNDYYTATNFSFLGPRGPWPSKKIDDHNFVVFVRDIFFLFPLFQNNHFATLLPPLNNQTMTDLSMHFLKVYAGLWCCPKDKILGVAEMIIRKHLGNNLRYVSVHKRNMEGKCSRFIKGATVPSDYRSNEIPIHFGVDPITGDWNNEDHPLCQMNLAFISSTMELHNRSNAKIFASWDSDGDVHDMLQHGVIFSSILRKQHKVPWNVDLRYVDMLVAMHSDLFILNPRSTYSWQVYVIRVCLALVSVPVIRNNDYLLLDRQTIEEQRRPQWVSPMSILDAIMETNGKIK